MSKPLRQLGASEASMLACRSAVGMCRPEYLIFFFFLISHVSRAARRIHLSFLGSQRRRRCGEGVRGRRSRRNGRSNLNT